MKFASSSLLCTGGKRTVKKNCTKKQLLLCMSEEDIWKQSTVELDFSPEIPGVCSVMSLFLQSFNSRSHHTHLTLEWCSNKNNHHRLLSKDWNGIVSHLYGPMWRHLTTVENLHSFRHRCICIFKLVCKCLQMQSISWFIIYSDFINLNSP